MHVSSYRSSWGCPTIDPDVEKRHRIIKKLAENGPSLVVNYGENMEDPKDCSTDWREIND